jgi:hypothetical protein
VGDREVAVKIGDKRKVIEVLLCCGRDPYGFNGTTGDFARAIGATKAADAEARKQWNETRLDIGFCAVNAEHGEICITAAYRLIESSPTLRREWFGAR